MHLICFFLDWYLFQLIFILKPDSNCSSSFTLPCVDKVTTGTWPIVSVIVNVGTWFAAVPEMKKQFFEQFYIRLISQLINDISSAKLFRCFNGIIISTYFVLLFPVFFCNFFFNLNDILSLLLAEKSVISSLLCKIGLFL